MSFGSIEERCSEHTVESHGMKCLFVDQLRGRRPRPCAALPDRAISSSCWETESICEWWTAEAKDGKAVTFRCFPTSNHLPRTAPQRLVYVRQEYEEALKKAYEQRYRRFRDCSKLADIWNLAAQNAVFARIMIEREQIKRFRPACGCEIAAWLAGHKDDFLAIKDPQHLITTLLEYVPTHE